MSDLLANKYKKAFNRLYKKLSPDLKARVDKSKDNPTYKDKEVDEFVRKVCELAENGIMSDPKPQ